jgi:hypothetical protein
MAIVTSLASALPEQHTVWLLLARTKSITEEDTPQQEEGL